MSFTNIPTRKNSKSFNHYGMSERRSRNVKTTINTPPFMEDSYFGCTERSKAKSTV